MKVVFRNIHLYLSLAAGLVIMTCCFTGAILVFEKELQEAFNHNRYFVKQQTTQLPIEQLINNVKQKYSEAKIVSVKIYPNAERSVEIGVSIAEKNKRGTGNSKAKSGENRRAEKEPTQAGSKTSGGQKSKQPSTAGGEGRQTHTAFVNPYTGQIIELYNYRETFFFTMFSLHRWLLGGNDGIGKTITGISTFIFLFILITGIILWWPRNKAILKQRLKIKTDASWKRVNHDLHLVLGFYSAIFLFIFAFTALAWSFKWFNQGIYTVTKSSMKPAEPPRSTYHADKKRISYDSAFRVISNTVSDVQFYNLRAPNDSTGIYSVSVLSTGAHETAADNYYIDQYSGQVIGNLKFRDRNLGQRVRSTFKPVHVGSIYGLPSKIIAFLVCIFGVTFPITGTIMWINRLRKKKMQKVGS
ncbi:MAG TPA: PepSY-associated TM helix domain-containing protein, partial [Segetibacter sp.]